MRREVTERGKNTCIEEERMFNFAHCFEPSPLLEYLKQAKIRKKGYSTDRPSALFWGEQCVLLSYWLTLTYTGNE